jgi:hypothetical protein
MLDNLGMPAHGLLNYSYHDIPLKKSGKTERLPACVLGEYCRINGENQARKNLDVMMKRETANSIIQKYVNAIDFLTKNSRRSEVNDKSQK